MTGRPVGGAERVLEGEHPAPPGELVEPAPLTGPSAIGVRLRAVPGIERGVFPVALFGSTFGWSVQERAAHEILDEFVLGGGNLLQTSEHHAQGNSERMIGRWLTDRGIRDHVLLSCSVARTELGDGSPSALVAAAEGTLQRLGTDRIDLLVLYGARGEAALDNLLAAAERLVSAGKAIAVGAGDFSGVQLLQARIAAGLIGAPLLSAVQATYNLLQRSGFEAEYARVAQVQQLAVMPKHALANGYLTGVYRSRELAQRSERGMLAFRHHDRRAQRILQAVDELAEGHGVEPATIALAWLLSRPGVVAPVVSAGGVRHVAALLAAARLELGDEALAMLDKASR